MKDACFLVNPFSGGRAGKRLAELLRSAGMPHVVELELDSISKQFEEARRHELIVLGGGDGTVSHALPALLEYRGRVALLPLGTGNDLARETGIFRHFSLADVRPAVRAIEAASARPFSIWRVAPEDAPGPAVLFCNYLSLGGDAAVVGEVDAWRRRRSLNAVFRFGVPATRAAYAVSGMRRLLRRAVIGATIESADSAGQPQTLPPCVSLLFPNIRSIMGCGISSSYADAGDDLIEAVGVTTAAQYAGMVARRVFGVPSRRHPQARGWVVRGVPPGTAVQVDGEIRRDLAAGAYRISRAGTINVTYVE